MDLKINDLSAVAAKAPAKATDVDDEFKQAVESAVIDRDSAYNSIYFNNKSFVAISPKFEKKMQQDPKLAEDTATRIDNLTKVYGGEWKDNIIVIDRSGEIKLYSAKQSKREKELEELEAENLKEAIKARLRKKARVDAYFKIVERSAIKRKLIEQENAKRARNKRYRTNLSKLNGVAQSIAGANPSTAADILSMLE